jgi:hypothetical protein
MNRQRVALANPFEIMKRWPPCGHIVLGVNLEPACVRAAFKDLAVMRGLEGDPGASRDRDKRMR